MTTCRYLTENPFRLLNVGSATTYRDLLRKSRSAEHAARVGLAPQPALSHLFGDAELPNCADTVPGLGSDPVRLTLYRLFWPLSLEDAALSEAVGDLPGGPAHREDESASRHASEGFAGAWLCFETNPTPQLFQRVQERRRRLSVDDKLGEAMVTLLMSDGHTSDRARTATWEALQLADDWMEERVRQHVREAREAGERLRAARLELALPFHRAPDEVVQGLFERGQALSEQFWTLAGECSHWTPGHDIALVEVTILRDIIAHLEQRGVRTEALAGWHDNERNYVLRMGRVIRECALDCAERNGAFGDAYLLLLQAAELPLDEELAWLVEEDLRSTWRQMRPLERNSRKFQEAEAARQLRLQRDAEEPQELHAPSAAHPAREGQRSAEVTPDDAHTLPASVQAINAQTQSKRWPVKRIPDLYVRKGVGNLIYGRTLFFVILFIPILPLAHYDVTLERGVYQFHAELPFERWHKIWWVVVILAVVSVFSYFYWSTWGPTSSRPIRDSINTPAPAPRVGTTSSLQLQRPPRTDKGRRGA